MSLWKIAWRSIEQRALASALTAFSMALGVALVVTVLVIHQVVDHSFRRGAQGYNLIVGAKGGRLELVLSTVYHIGRPIENIPYKYYLEFTEGRFRPSVEVAIPICMGDSYEGFPVIGTLPEMFTKLQYQEGQKYEFAAGGNFHAGNEYEAVAGWQAAREAGLAVGGAFRPAHGLFEKGEHGPEHRPFTVAGVLAPTGTPMDRALFVNMEGFFHLEGHARPGAAAEPHEPAAELPSLLAAAGMQPERYQQAGVPEVHGHHVQGKAQHLEKLDKPEGGRQRVGRSAAEEIVRIHGRFSAGVAAGSIPAGRGGVIFIR